MTSMLAAPSRTSGAGVNPNPRTLITSDAHRETEVAVLMTGMVAAPSQHNVVVAQIARRVAAGPVQVGLDEIERERRILDNSAPRDLAKTTLR